VLNLRRVFSFLFIAMICLAILSGESALDDVTERASSSLTTVEMAIKFLISRQFTASLGLCREAPNAEPNVYWLVSDNLWVWKALKMANESGLQGAVEAGQVAESIEAKLKESAVAYNLPKDAEGLPKSFMHEAVICDVIPTPNRTSTDLTLQSGDYVVKTEIYNGSEIHNWEEYADRLLYMALSLHWQGNDTAAIQYLENATNGPYACWDGVGINDAATRANGNYATYKLALLLYTSKVLGKRLSFEFELVNRIWSLQREADGGIITNYFANGTSIGDANTETTSIVIISVFAFPNVWPDVFAFYYPWYGTPEVSGYWRHWNDLTHNPDDFINGRRDIAATDYPLLDVYDSNNESLIKEHIDMAKKAGIDGFVVSWWGIGSFEDEALLRVKNVCEQSNFEFTIYYETTAGLDNTIEDISYLLDKYGNSSSWYRIDGRPVIYIYGRAIQQLNPTLCWNVNGLSAFWSLTEDMREPPRYGIFVIHPYDNGTVGYLESNPITLLPSDTYTLHLAISDFRNDCPPNSDVGFRIKIKNETSGWETLDDLIVNFNDGWLNLSYDTSSYANQTVSIRVESYAGGVMNWCSEWAAVDYFYIQNSKGEIINKEPYFDNEWKPVVNNLNMSGYNPYFIMDFGGYMNDVQDFADYFLNFTDGIHTYAPVGLSTSNISAIYDEASDAAHDKNKTFVATVMPGYNDTKIRSPGYAVDRQNGTYYTSFWSVATACFPDGYVITSFNEWHEGTEIEPSLEYGYQYIPEFSDAAILAMFMVIITLVAIVKKKLNKINN
jgi:hypothetical protein